MERSVPCPNATCPDAASMEKKATAKTTTFGRNARIGHQLQELVFVRRQGNSISGLYLISRSGSGNYYRSQGSFVKQDEATIRILPKLAIARAARRNEPIVCSWLDERTADCRREMGFLRMTSLNACSERKLVCAIICLLSYVPVWQPE